MAEKKGFWNLLFGGGGCSCGMSFEDENDAPKKQTKKGGCCDMQIVEEYDGKDSAGHETDKLT